MFKFLNRFSSVAGTCAILALSACATHSYDSSATPGMSDPFEQTNRAVLDFNMAMNNAVIFPVVDGYRAIVPDEGRKGVDNFVDNLKGPLYFANEILQGDLVGAGDVFVSTMVNTLVGFGGLFDFAGAEGYDHDHEDFGQTLAVWGVPDGPFLVLPLLGPSSFRDGTGLAVESVADPVRIYAFDVDHDDWHYKRVGVGALSRADNTKDLIEELEAGSNDFYATLRSTYYQNRQAEIKDHEIDEDQALVEYPDYDDEE